MIKPLFSKAYSRHPAYDLIAEAEKWGVAYGKERAEERIINLLHQHLGHVDWNDLVKLIKEEPTPKGNDPIYKSLLELYNEHVIENTKKLEG
jgi:hypothetical protein